MNTKVGFVFSHPAAHELLLAGLMQRYQPDILFLTQGDSGSPGSSKVARDCLEKVGFANSLTFLEMSEKESYQKAFAHDFSFYVHYRDLILDWLNEKKINVIFGDAFELYNFHHDICRLLVDSAIDAYDCGEAPLKNYEYANLCRADDNLQQLKAQEFPFTDSEEYLLSPEEIQGKQQLLDLIQSLKPEVDLGTTSLALDSQNEFYKMDREIYREVPQDRDYSMPPKGIKFHYDEWGQMQVSRGKYQQALLFEEHFVPLAKYLQSV